MIVNKTGEIAPRGYVVDIFLLVVLINQNRILGHTMNQFVLNIDTQLIDKLDNITIVPNTNF